MASTRTGGLSVIIPFYDETAFLRMAVNSVLAQGIDGLQLLIVNDNPARFDAAAIRALGVPDDAAVLEHVENRGLSAARNTGLAVATCDHVAFLDADDYYVQGGLSRHLAYARETGADITHAQTFFSRQGSPAAVVLPRDRLFFGTRKSGGGLTEQPEAQFIVSSWSSLYRRDFLDANALRFDDAQRKFEDRLFVLHTVTRAARIAFLGEATRVWRRRAGSISVTAPDPEHRMLQLQLVEKCLAHIRAETTSGRLPPIFERRELFNTVSRLIWDMDIVSAMAADPSHALAARVAAMLGPSSFAHQIFDDPIVANVNRTGMPSRIGRIRRVDFFAIHKALREANPAAAQAVIAGASTATTVSPFVRRQGRGRLILHLGGHKTGSTYLQHHLEHHRARLAQAGILVPMTGRPPEDQRSVRFGGYPGHQGLVTALRDGDTATWDALYREVADSGAGTVVISCENMVFPTNIDRDRLIADLGQALSGFDSIDPVMLLRAPHDHLEAFYKERATGETRAASRSYEEFLVDHETSLTDLPALLGPLEQALGSRIRIEDFDRLRAAGDLWSGFCRFVGLPADLPAVEVPRYPSIDRDTVLMLRVLHSLVVSPVTRQEILRACFARDPAPVNGLSLVSPSRRASILAGFRARSQSFAAERGYRPDYDAMAQALAAETWTPPLAIDAAVLTDMVEAAQRTPRLWVHPDDLGGPAPQPLVPTGTAPHREPAGITLRLRPRPWVRRIVRRFRNRNVTG